MYSDSRVRWYRSEKRDNGEEKEAEGKNRENNRWLKIEKEKNGN